MSDQIAIHFTTDLGAQVSVSAASADQVLELQRRYGKRGWYSGTIPPGGLILPYDNEHDFDWRLIGGRRFADKETGEIMVWCRGHAWKRRELAAVESKKMTLPAAIKYSRGAKPTDPPAIREQGDGEIEYVTLCIFRGGTRRDTYAVPGDEAGGESPDEAPMVTPNEADAFFKEIVSLGMRPQEVHPIVKQVTGQDVRDLTKLTKEQLEQVRRLVVASLQPKPPAHEPKTRGLQGGRIGADEAMSAKEVLR